MRDLFGGRGADTGSVPRYQGAQGAVELHDQTIAMGQAVVMALMHNLSPNVLPARRATAGL